MEIFTLLVMEILLLEAGGMTIPRSRSILDKWIKSLKQAGINQLKGNIVCSNKNRESQTIPGGWIWDDIGNYYGAGVSALTGVKINMTYY